MLQLDDAPQVTRALAAGIPAAQLSVGLGTISNAFPTEFGWNRTDLVEYLDWVDGLGITNIGVWRSDLDVYGSKDKVATAPFFLAVLEQFLGT